MSALAVTPLNTSKVFVRGIADGGCEVYYPVPVHLAATESDIKFVQDMLQQELDERSPVNPLLA